MTDLEIQTWIESNMLHEDGTPMIDTQSFYEGAKWMRDQALNIADVVGRSEQLFCGGCGIERELSVLTDINSGRSCKNRLCREK